MIPLIRQEAVLTPRTIPKTLLLLCTCLILAFISHSEHSSGADIAAATIAAGVGSKHMESQLQFVMDEMAKLKGEMKARFDLLTSKVVPPATATPSTAGGTHPEVSTILFFLL